MTVRSLTQGQRILAALYAGPVCGTMIFGGEHDDAQWRCATEAEALAGHAEAVRLAWGES